MKKINDFLLYIQSSLENQSIPTKLNEMIIEKSSSAGSSSKEEIFTREFLCPAISKYFYSTIFDTLSLRPEEIKKGLGAEGFKNATGFGYTPARKERHFFTKSEFVKTKPPQVWFNDQEKFPTRFQACPDFAIRNPLPFSALGEVKYFKKGGAEAAQRELFNGIRQSTFYLAAYRNEYDCVLLIIADESEDKVMKKCVDSLHEDIKSRFGMETGIFILVIGL